MGVERVCGKGVMREVSIIMVSVMHLSTIEHSNIQLTSGVHHRIIYFFKVRQHAVY